MDMFKLALLLNLQLHIYVYANEQLCLCFNVLVHYFVVLGIHL